MPRHSRYHRLRTHLYAFGMATVMGLLCLPTDAGAEAPPETDVLTGTRTRYRPILRFEPGYSLISGKVSFRGHAGLIDAFPTDKKGTTYEPERLTSVELRAAMRYDSRVSYESLRYVLDLEYDLITGSHSPFTALEGAHIPASHGIDHALRKASFRVSVAKQLHLMGGYTTSKWGLGLISNDGNFRWRPGSADFRDPRGGDRVLRAMIASGQLTAAKLQLLAAFDDVVDDEEMIPGDSARQIMGALRFKLGGDTGGGMLWRVRLQQGVSMGELRSHTLDWTGHTAITLGAKQLRLSFEALFQTGTTSLPRHEATEERDLRTFGGALEADLDLGGYGIALDALYASGDSDPEDGVDRQLKLDPNYGEGLIFFPYVLGAQSGRIPAQLRAKVGANDAEEHPWREASRGGVTNAIALFPRAWWRYKAGMEIYGGALFVWSPNEPRVPSPLWSDPDIPENVLGGTPGGFLGTELDVGWRYNILLDGSALCFGAEAGIFFFGSGLETADENAPDDVRAARVMMSYQM